MRHVVAGAGYTGRRVLAASPDSIGLNRSPVDGLTVHVVDFDDEGAFHVFETPYSLLYTVPPAQDGDDDLRLARFLEGMRPTPVRLVYLSTSGVYGNRDGALVDESTAPDPQTPRAARRLWAEHLLESWCGEHGVELVILRVPAIYGPARLGVERLRDGQPMIADADASPGNRIHVDDLVSCCLAALRLESPPGVYNVGDGDHRSSSAFSRTVASLAGLPAPPEVTLEEAKRTFSPARLSFLEESRRLDTTKMRTVLGVEPRYPRFEEGIRDSLGEFASSLRSSQ